MTGINEIAAAKTTDDDYRRIIISQAVQLQKVTRYAYELEDEITRLRHLLDKVTPPETET